jgi:dTDP-4-amino-4,6-dideoxygalactose transaminase
MTKMGIETGIHYKPIHKMSMYRTNTKLPVTEEVGQQIVILPTHPNLTEQDVSKIIECANKFC